MGQAQSLQSANILSREEILKRTQGGKLLIGEIFSWMVNQADIKEFYLLANPDHCRKYIFVTANALQSLFRKVQLEPREGEKGTIYLQHVETLINPKDQQQKKAHDFLCLKLAFFYVRIFQIFAALTFSVIDNDTGSSGYQLLGKQQAVPLLGNQNTRQRGGKIPSNIPLPRDLEPLRYILDMSETSLKSNKFALGDTNIIITINPDKSYHEFDYQFQSGELFDGRQININGFIQVNSSSDKSRLDVLLGEISCSLDENKTLVDRKSFSFAYDTIDKAYVSSGDNPIEKVLDDYLMNEVYQKIIKKVFGKGDVKKSTDYFKFSKESPRYPDFERAVSGVKEGLHTQILLGAFNQQPKAHCIARSLQLLSESGIQSQFPSEVYSSICKTKFLTESKSLPPAEREITSEIGIYALAQLFYDTLQEATPIIGEKTKEQQKEFLAKMKFVFEEKREEQVQSIDKIRNKLPSAICDAKTLDRSLKITNRDVIRQVRNEVRGMIDIQIAHTANVVLLLKKLFLLPIQPGKSLQIHPNVKKNGIQEVNRIAAEARALLIKYYEQCEIRYRVGANLIARNKSLVTVV